MEEHMTVKEMIPSEVWRAVVLFYISYRNDQI